MSRGLVHVLDSSAFDRHVSQHLHPERPGRLDAARAAVRRRTDCVPDEAPEATDDDLARVHGAALVRAVRTAWDDGIRALDADTYVSAGTWDAARRGSGAAIEVVRRILETPGTHGLALGRPPGHHACRDRAMGFCALNHVAVAAAWARDQGVPRVAVVDWDVHHGNGTAEIFDDDPSVLFVSLHQAPPHYPGSGHATETGSGAGVGRTVNLPVPAGADGSWHRDAFASVVLPVLEAFDPGLILVSAGFDAHRADPLGSLALVAADFGWMASTLAGYAEDRARGAPGIGMVLEGGYDLAALEASLSATLDGLRQPTRPSRDADALPPTRFPQTAAALAPHWPDVASFHRR